MESYRRDFKHLCVKGQKDVNLKFLKNGILHYQLIVEVDSNTLEFKDLKVISLENSAVGRLLCTSKFREFVMPAIEEDLLQTPEDDEAEKEKQVAKWKNVKSLNYELKKQNIMDTIPDTPVQVMAMTQKQLEIYFPMLIEILYKMTLLVLTGTVGSSLLQSLLE